MTLRTRHNYTYQAFGEVERRSGSTENNYLFAGERKGENLADYYLRQRFYDSETGRFFNKDSYSGRLFEPLSLHDYIYSHNNPANLTDPSGLNALLLEQSETVTVLLILIELWNALDNIYSPNSISGLRSKESVNEFLSKYVPYFGIESDSSEDSGVGDLPEVPEGVSDPKNLTDKPKKVAQVLKRTEREIKDAIHDVKRDAGIIRTGSRSNPDVEIDIRTGEVYPKAGNGRLGDSIGNILDHLP
jgi:RHS repeat-associated protein